MLNVYLQTLKSGYWVVVRGEHDEKITDVKFTLNDNTLGLLKLGKKKFYNIVKK